MCQICILWACALARERESARARTREWHAGYDFIPNKICYDFMPNMTLYHMTLYQTKISQKQAIRAVALNWKRSSRLRLQTVVDEWIALRFRQVPVYVICDMKWICSMEYHV